MTSRIINPTIFAADSGATSTHSLSLDNSSNEYIDCGDITELDSTAAFTWSGWVRIKGGSTTVIYGLTGKTTGNSQFSLVCWSNAAFYINLRSGSVTYATLASYHLNGLPLDTWVHVAVVYDGSGSTNADKLKLYFDGTSKTLSYTGTIPTTTADMSGNSFLIGKRPDNATEWDGLIDDVRLFSDAKSSGDISTLATGGDVSSSLIGHWMFDETLNDETSSYDGTYQGGGTVTYDTDTSTAF